MLAVVEEFRGKGIATKLVQMAIEAMKARDADEVCLLHHRLETFKLTRFPDCPRNRDHEHRFSAII